MDVLNEKWTITGIKSLFMIATMFISFKADVDSKIRGT